MNSHSYYFEKQKEKIRERTLPRNSLKSGKQVPAPQRPSRTI